MQLFQHVFKSSTIFPQNNHRHMIKFTSVLSSHFHNIRKHYFPSAAKYWGFERCFWTTWLVLVQVQVWLRYRTRDTRYVECRVTTECPQEAGAVQSGDDCGRVLVTLGSSTHMSSPETGESSYSQGANNISQKQYLDMVPYSTLLKAAYIVFTLTNV